MAGSAGPVSGPLLGPEQLDVHMLLDRWVAGLWKWRFGFDHAVLDLLAVRLQ